MKTSSYELKVQFLSQLYNILLSTMRRICPKYREIQIGMYFFVYTDAPGAMDYECELIPVFKQYLGKYVTYKYVLYIIRKVFLQHFCSCELHKNTCMFEILKLRIEVFIFTVATAF